MSSSDSNFYHDDPVDFDESPRKKKFSSILALLSLFVGAGFYVQTTLASNIALNAGAPVEFGQGVTQLTSCTGDSNLTLTPTSTFVNASSAGAFYFNSVTVSGIPATSKTYDFTINAFGNTDQAPLSIFNTNSKNAVIRNSAGTFSLGAGSTGMSISSGSGTFTATFTNPVALATSVFKVVIQCGAQGSAAATDWVSRTAMSVEGWGGIAYGNGTYVAVGYGGRREITDAVRSLLSEHATRGTSIEELAELIDIDHIAEHLYTRGQPDPDLVIRTSGEQRLSGFLLWQSAHSEFYFCEAYWPDFRRIDFLRALRDFGARSRRFGS